MSDPDRRARRTVLGVLAACIAYRCALSLAVAAPWSLAAAPIVAGQPAGDALLFRPGGMWLVETVRLLRPLVPALVGSAGLLLLLGALGWQPLLGALVGARGPAGADRHRQSWACAWDRYGRLTLAWGLASLAQAVLLAVGAAAGRFSVGLWWSPEVGWLCGGIAGIVLAALVGLAHDLARAEIVWHDRPVYDAVASALRRLAAAPLRLSWAAGWRALVAAVAGLGAALCAPLPAGFGIATLGVAAAVHVAMRASWFGWLAMASPPR